MSGRSAFIPFALFGALRFDLGWGVGHLPDISTMTKWFYSTRLETRTKESNTYASHWVQNPKA